MTPAPTIDFGIRTPVAITPDNAVNAYQRDLTFFGIYSQLGKAHRQLAIMGNQLGHVVTKSESFLNQLAEDRHQRELRELRALNRMIIADNKELRLQLKSQQAEIDNLKVKLATLQG